MEKKTGRNEFGKTLGSLNSTSLQIISNALWKYHEYCVRELAGAIEDGLLSLETIKTCRRNNAEIFRLANLFDAIIDAPSEEGRKVNLL